MPRRPKSEKKTYCGRFSAHPKADLTTAFSERKQMHNHVCIAKYKVPQSELRTRENRNNVNMDLRILFRLKC
jgi:hypothetical protein